MLSEALARLHHRVLYVDPPVSPFSVLRDRSRLRDLFATSSSEPLPGLQLWRPRVLPGQNARLVMRGNTSILRAGVERRMPKPDVVIAFSLEARAVFPELGGVHVYYCTDSLEDAPAYPGFHPELVRAREDQLLAAADVVVACSRPLQAQLSARGWDPVYLPHGCEIGAMPVRAEPPRELVGRRRPYVGYLGSLSYRLDAGGTLVIVGAPSRADGPRPDNRVLDLLSRPDVVVIGYRAAAALPSYLAVFDVAVVPYADHPFNRKSYPIKIPQCLAAGLAVVSSPNGATDELGDVVTVAADAGAFEEAVRGALQSDSAAARERRRLRVASRPWEVVAEELLQACGHAPTSGTGASSTA